MTFVSISCIINVVSQKSGHIRLRMLLFDDQKGFRIAMMKKLLALVLALLAVLSFSACSNKEEDKEDLNDYRQDEVVYTSYTDKFGTFYFETLDSDSVAITGYTGSTEPHDITVPSAVQVSADESAAMRKVTAIADTAFYADSSLRSVTLPEGITDIGDYAFAKCVQLESINFPTTLKAIGQGAFMGCGLKQLSFPDSCGLTELSLMSFSECMSLTSVTVPSYITTIGRAAFYNCRGITEIVISEGVTTIERQAFQDTVSLADLTLPATFTNTNPLEDLVFSGSKVLYRDHIVCPDGSAAEAYADRMNLSAPPTDE